MAVPLLIARAAVAAESAAARTAAATLRAGGSRATAHLAGRIAFDRAVAKGPSLLSQLRGMGWDLQAWHAMLEKDFPGVTHKTTVRAQGAPQTHLNAVVHLALAAAFGTTLFSPRVLSQSAVSVTVNHTTNTVMVEFGYRSWTTADMLLQAYENVVRSIPGAAAVAGGSIKISKGDMKGGVKDVARGSADIGVDAILKALEAAAKIAQAPANWFAGAGTKDATPEANGSRPPLEGNQVQENKAAQEEARKREAFEEAAKKGGFFSRALGTLSVYNMGRHTIRGGAPVGLLDTTAPGDRPLPFREMVGQPILTRDAAANPPPPTGTAAVGPLDLRTLVAQVLHDPGVRPPAPRTDAGPPLVENEFLGR